ncbi:hypothetical protein ADIS_2145 [Lunatimonas lonarensis]|uniref:Colicin V production protein n=1 Tax=Lunatimonas lonarensis TaxID=1232681 RepID=R7ZT64_9BACT|nr:CvpA family protein [Lunatimonas lonarensis]EON77277.1 hypothetical protein ADIS_2145 [Lunatimonas lonarensis]
MATIDVILLGMLGIGAYSGYKKGLFIGILTIIAFFFGLIVAFRFMHWGAALLSEHVESLTFMLPFISFLLIFFVVTALIRLLAYVVKQGLNLTILGTFDSFAGLVLGVLKWAMMISLLLWVANAFDFKAPDSFREGAVIYPMITPIAPTVVDMLDRYTPIIETTMAAVQELVNSGAGDPTN